MAGMNELLEKLKNDKAFVNNLNSAESGAEFGEKLREAGFELSPKEFFEGFTALESIKREELSDGDLSIVAGGLSYTDVPDFIITEPWTGMSQDEYDQFMAIMASIKISFI